MRWQEKYFQNRLDELQREWNEFFAAQPKEHSKEDGGWEIVSQGYIGEESNKTIFSVRRKSDGEVFSVGDEVGNEKIVSFWVEGKDMMAKLHGKYGTTSILIKSLYLKSKPIEKEGAWVHKDDLPKRPSNAKEYYEQQMSKIKSEKERIEVQVNEPYMVNTRQFLPVYVKGLIDSDDIPAIKEAIEKVLNDEPVEKHYVMGKWMGAHYFGSNGEKLYTEKDLEDAFNAGRNKDVNSLSHLDQSPYYKFPTFTMYKNQLPNQ